MISRKNYRCEPFKKQGLFFKVCHIFSLSIFGLCFPEHFDVCEKSLQTKRKTTYEKEVSDMKASMQRWITKATTAENTTDDIDDIEQLSDRDLNLDDK